MTVNVEINGNVGIFMDKLKAKILQKSPDLLMKAAWIATGEVRREIYDKAKNSRGGLARSFEPKAVDTQDGTVVGTFSDLPYARIQDEGGTIRAKDKLLAIPIGDRARSVAGLWPRDWARDSLFCFKSRQGNLLLARRDREPGDRDFLQYVLKKAVTLKTHPLKGYLGRAAQASAPLIEELVSDGIDKSIEEAKTESK